MDQLTAPPQSLKDQNLTIADLLGEIIGRGTRLRTPFGERLMTYADYTASGRNLRFVESYLGELQEIYGNTHTEDTESGLVTSDLLAQAEECIKRSVNADDSTCLIATGSGSTGAILRFQELLGLRFPPATWERLEEALEPHLGNGATQECLKERLADRLPVVFVGPYEHHSNEVSWRECFAEVVEVRLTSDGLLDLADLEAKVADPRYDGRFKIGSFSSSSNVTGIRTPLYEVAKLLHRHGALACFDFAASAPYCEIDMNRDDESYFDAIFISPHKYLGGPGSCGVLLFRDDLYRCDLPPSCSGGGTVDYVGPHDHDYLSDIEEREKAGTPPILQLMRAALAMDLKETLGFEAIEATEHRYLEQVMDRFLAHPGIHVLGNPDPRQRMAVISFNIRHGDKFLHPKLVARLLNDLFGVQARAGCSCAGPYGHRLLGIDDELSERYRAQLQAGFEGIKPGWVRIGLHYTLTTAEIEFLCRSIEMVAEFGSRFLPQYELDMRTAVWSRRDGFARPEPAFGIAVARQERGAAPPAPGEEERNRELERYLAEAQGLADQLADQPEAEYATLPGELEELRFFNSVSFRL
ncbi:MAG: aminotransferase class V-fold PLP-dependent enzyme [Acidobacteriota bacterium]